MTAAASSLTQRQHYFIRRFRIFARRVNLARKLTIATVAGAMISAMATYIALTSAPPFGSDPQTVFVLMNINIVLLLIVSAIVGRRLLTLWMQRRQGVAGSKMHSRMALLFSVVAILPAIIVAVFSLLFFNFGVNTWFSDRVTTALDESQAVAQAYLEEHQQAIRADILAMANDLNRQAGQLLGDRQLFQRAVRTHAALRNFSEVLVFNGHGDILARAGMTFVLEMEPVPEDAFRIAKKGDVALVVSEEGDRVRALVPLESFIDTYLYVGRFVEPSVLSHIEKTDAAVEAFEALKLGRSGLQISFAVIFIVVVLIMLIVSVWVGLSLATGMIAPIGQLVNASERVRAGDLSVQIDDTELRQTANEEMITLTRSFNRMTAQLKTQREDLIHANRQLDDRRRFMEAVLSGVSAGIIGLDAKGRIQYPNDTANSLLNINLQRHIGENISNIIPEFSNLLEMAAEISSSPVETQIKLKTGKRTKTFLVRLTSEMKKNKISGYVLTFDDITDLMTAQRTAAWANVARQLAHEIRNPLTPIQLSAERLKSKYGPQIKKERDSFNEYTDLIVRQVDDLGQMLDEFSSFARMPAPEMKKHDITKIVTDTTLLMRQSHPDITFELKKSKNSVMLNCDATQLRQSLINVLKNAAEAIEEQEKRPEEVPEKGPEKGKVTLTISQDPDQIIIKIKDNGPGLPAESSERLTEPYYTTRRKGTGLGLAVVSKIMEDHNGEVLFENNARKGATVSLAFTLKHEAENTETTAETLKILQKQSTANQSKKDKKAHG